jgi:hypothetical protein
MDLPTAVTEEDTYQRRHHGDYQVDDLLNVFFGVVRCISWKDDSRIGKGNKEEQYSRANACPEKVRNRIPGGRFEENRRINHSFQS